MKVALYLIEQKTGIFDSHGVELTILCDVKLSRVVAERVRDEKYPGAIITKWYADKNE